MMPTRRLCSFLTLTLLLAGCPPTPPAGPVTGKPPYTPEQMSVVTDPCPQRLQDVADALLIYYSSKKQLPPSLESLRTFTGQDVKLVCPTSGKPYVYVPAGLHIEDQRWILFVYDADAVHHGIRWAVVGMQEDEEHPVTMRVVPMDNDTLQKYINASLVTVPGP